MKAIAFSAGEVFVILGGRFSPAGFNRFGAATRRAGADMKRAERDIAKSQNALAASAVAMGRATKAGAAIGFGAIAAGVVVSVKAAADFEQQMDRVQAVTGASAKQMGVLAKQAKTLGPAYGKSAIEAGRAQEELAKGGVSVSKIQTALKGTLALSAAGSLDLAEAAATTANALNLFKLEGKDASHIADVFATAANKTTADVHDFSMALRQGGSAAKAAGLSFDETMVALEALAANGIKGSDAGTSLKTTLVQIAAPTKKAQQVMDKLGISFFNASGTMKTLPQISDNLRKSLGGLTDQQRLAAAKTIAGTDGLRTLLALYDQGPARLRAFAQANNDSGVAAEVAATKQDNLRGKMEKLKNTAQVLAIEVGTRLLPGLTELAQGGLDKITGALSDGTASRIGDQVEQGFNTIREVVTETGAVVVPIATTVVGALQAIGDALNVGDASTIEAVIAGIAGFRIAAVVAPAVIALGSALGTLFVAIRTGTTALLAGSLASMVNPITALATAAGLAAAAFVYLKGRESEDEAATRSLADAKRDLKDALDSLSGDELSTAEAGRRRLDALKDEEAVGKRLSDLRKKGKGDTREARVLEDQLKDAHLRTLRAQKTVTDSQKALNDNRGKAAANAAKQQLAAQDKLIAAEERLEEAHKKAQEVRDYGGRAKDLEKKEAEALLDVAKAQDVYNASVEESVKANARVALSEANVARQREGLNAITKENEQGVGLLFATLKSLPKSVKTRLEVDDQGALAKVGRLSQQLAQQGKTKIATEVVTKADSAKSAAKGLGAVLAGVPDRKVIDILARTGNSKQEISQLNAEVRKVKGKRVDVDANAQAAIAALRQIQGTKIDAKVARVLGDSRDAQSKVRALIALGIPPKTAKVLANVGGALSGVSSVQGALNALQNKTITVTTIRRTIGKVASAVSAEGRAPGSAVTSVVGEGSRWQGAREAIVDPKTMSYAIVDKPQVVDLAPHQYVVPSEPMFRGRAMGLMQSLAADLGLSSYARGRKGKKKGKAGGGSTANTRPHPAHVDPISLPTQAIEDRRQAALAKLNDAKSKAGKVDDDLDRVRDIKGRKAVSKETKAKKARDLADAQRTLAEHRKAKASVPALRADYKQWQRGLDKARAFQEQITKQEQLADIAADQMRLADGRDDQGAYDTAKGQRVVALKELKRLLGLAQAVVRPDSEYARDLAKKIGEQDLELQDLESGAQGEQEESPAQVAAREAAERLAETGMTDAERSRLAELKAQQSLAALTQPLEDDKAAAEEIERFYSGLLESVKADPARGGAPVIAEVADTLKQARDNLASLTGGGANENENLQAQLDQANDRVRVAQEEARINARVLEAYRGSGDIIGPAGRGGGVTINQTVNTLHPGDPRTSLAVANAAVTGMGYQNPRPSPRQTVGA